MGVFEICVQENGKSWNLYVIQMRSPIEMLCDAAQATACVPSSSVEAYKLIWPLAGLQLHTVFPL